jgi:hypothetical protein
MPDSHNYTLKKMEELRKRLYNAISVLQQEKLEIMGLLAPMSISKCNPNASKSDFDLRSLNKNILPHVSIDTR